MDNQLTLLKKAIIAEVCTFATLTVLAQKKSNILVTFGNDVGQTSISAYSFGLVGYKTPNLVKIAKEGMMITVTGKFLC